MDISVSQAEAFLKDFQPLLSAPAFPRLARYNQERNWFAYLNLQEGHYCSILQWLLSPQEGHGLDDFFLKRLLSEANMTALADPTSTMARHFSERLQDRRWLHIDELHTYPLHSAMVEREVQTSTGKRIDLLVVDPFLQMVVVIERKDGSGVRSNQLDHYQEWVEKAYPDYYHLLILSDSQGLDHQLDEATDWIQLDDSWLIDALKEALIPGRLSADMHQRLEDLLYHFDTEGAYRDPFFTGIENELNQFALDNRVAIQQLRKNPIAHLDSRSIMMHHLPNLNVNDEDTRFRALMLVCRYQSVLSDLLARDSLNGLSDTLIKQCPGIALEFETYDEALHIGTRGMQAAWEADKIADWPVYVSLVIPHQPTYTPEEGQDDKKLLQPTLTLTLDLLALGEDQQDQVRSLATAHGLTAKRRWAYKRQELTSEDAALSDMGRLIPWIQEMSAMARELGY